MIIDSVILYSSYLSAVLSKLFLHHLADFSQSKQICQNV